MCFGGIQESSCLSVPLHISRKRNFSLIDELKLDTVAVYILRMCMKEDVSQDLETLR